MEIEDPVPGRETSSNCQSTSTPDYSSAQRDYDPLWYTSEIPTSHLVEVTFLNGFQGGVMWQPCGCQSL
ncbi:hypothetical protein TNCT_381501 [Trichonephila clavata]|uniref:Uncharacterized protein n=1 Tax=Trichonephila clavata TaxID=2740835 RepID=A0A8X6G2P7_TRICU|nr:hypothetical protein TNCT_381501 [Trichonephila clavata]